MGAFVYNRRDGMAERYTSNGGYYVTGTALNDTIVNGGYYDSYDYYSLQADHYHRGDNVNINGWEGSDEILNYGDKVYINGGSGDDSIENHWGRNVTICGGKGDDTVICQGEGSELIEYAPGDGNDVIYNFFDDEGRGTPDIDYYGECIYIGTGDMNDTSKVDDSYFDGSDFILKIGNGSITLKDAKGKRFEIQDNYNNGGRGTYTKVKVLKDSSDTAPSSDDTLPHDDNVIYGTPNDDTLENSRNNARIEALSGNDTITNKGKSVAINGGSDDDSILNELDSDSSTIDGGAGSDRIDNRSLNVTIIGGAGDDFIINNGATVSIDAGDGNDYVTNRRGSSTINGGDGNDEISNSGNVVLVNGGTGDDTIANSAQRNVTIIGGKGDDSITNGILSEDGTQHDAYGRNVLFSYNTGDGSDTINGFNANSTLSISGGSYSSMTSGDDVIIKVGDGSITLKDAKGTSLNIIGTYTPDTTPPDNPRDDSEDNDDEPYWTLEDLQIFLDAVNFMAPPSMVKLSSWTDISSKFTGILESAIDIANGNKSITDLKSDFIELVGALASIKGDVKSLKGQDSTLWALAGSGLGGVASWIKAFDVAKIASIEEDREEVQRKIDEAVEGTADIVSDISSVIIDKIFESNLSASELRSLAGMKLNLKFKFGARAAIALIMVGYYGANQYRESIKQYSAEQLPLAMTAEATFVDVIVSALHGGAHYASLRLDDLAFKGLRWAYFKVTGQKPVNSGKDYMEWIGEVIKRGIFGSSSADDLLETDHDGESLYAQGGNDYIRNVFSNVKIYGGDDNDTIFSHEGSRRNYLNGNAGRDYIFALDTKSTAIGDSENDILMSSGDGNSISGGYGIDFILLQNVSDNIVNGGSGNDIIGLENAKKTVIYYAKNDGNDIIFGCDGDDTVHIAGKIEYSVVENGQDVYIKVGNGIITLKDAAGKNVKIENRDTADNPIDDINPFEANPIISSTISRISARASEQVIIDIDSLDDLTANGTSILTFTENSGSGIQNANLSSSEYPQAVSLEGGNQKIQFNDADGNVAIVGASATGSKEILFGSGDDLGIFLSPKADIKTTVGSGNDSIITDNNARVRADMTEADNAQIIPYSGRVILDNYDHESQAEIVLPEVTDITSAVKDNYIQLVGNEIRFDSSTVKIKNSATGSTLVNLATENGDAQKVGFTGLNGGSIDTSKLDSDFLLKGNYGENPSNRGSKITSGKGNDTILAGSGDSVNGGDGANQIYLTPKELRQNEGATVIFTDKGTNTVHGFNSGFNDTSDTLLFDANDAVDLKFDGTNLSLKTDNGAQGVLTDLADDVFFVTLFVADEDKRDKLAVAKKDATITVDDKNFARMYHGDNSGVDFSNTTKDLFVELDNDETLLFDGITQVTAGSGQNTLIGSDNAEILISGNGYNSIYGGGGNDSLVGKGGSADKDGRTTFFFFAGDGRDVISNFEFLTPQNRYEGIDDKIDVGDSDVNNAYISGDNLVIEFDQDSYLVLENASGKDFRINNLIAKVDKNIAYDGNANCYVADGGTSLKVESTVSSAEIWLDNSHDTLFLGTPIRTLDASEVKGNTSLVGNEYDNTIIAGQGDASLWGGDSASDDVLIGGNSRNTFFYCNGNGHDVIQGINDGDSVILADVSLEQITDTEITAKSVSINFIDGGSLRIEGNADVTYQLADGSKYSANHEQLEWIDK